MRAYVFVFFGSWAIIMTAFVYLLLPETRGVNSEEMLELFQRHWFWKKAMGPAIPIAGIDMAELGDDKVAIDPTAVVIPNIPGDGLGGAP